MVYLFDTTYISIELARHDIFRAKVGKGDIALTCLPQQFNKLEPVERCARVCDVFKRTREKNMIDEAFQGILFYC